MDPSKLRKRQIARRLGVSEQILEQYLQLKRAEVLPSKAEGAGSNPAGGRRGVPPKPGLAPAAPDRNASRPSRGSGQLRPVTVGHSRGTRRN